ncbi:MAG: S8 family serine peptidase [Pirellulales bacterium]
MDDPNPDPFVLDHATEVAGVMIGKDTPFADRVGVAPNAELHSMALVNIFSDDNGVALSLNRLATLNVNVTAINLSISPALQFSEDPDGNSHMSEFVDWSARQHDVLYVIAWGNVDENPAFRKPGDSFNGITVAGSERDGGVYRKWWTGNHVTEDAEGARTSVSLLAPGEGVEVLSLNNQQIPVDGTSFAAPHVTATTALLHQYAKPKVDAAEPRWTVNSRRHETMKAVLLNSADKLAGVHGSTRDVLNRFGQDWTDSPASMSSEIPLDEWMGAGHLNARRSLRQFQSGEYDPGLVPSIGWDFHTAGGPNDYIFDSQIGGGYIAATLVWDRRVEKITPGNYMDGDQFENQTAQQRLNNLDLYLMPANSTDLMDAISVSNSMVQNVEHIFFEILTPGEYKLVVVNNPVGGIGDNQTYALAWWFGNPSPPGDYNGNGSVGPEDYDLWRSSFGSTSSLAADGNGNNVIDAADYAVWRDNLGAGVGSGTAAAVPEPSSIVLALMFATAVFGTACRSSVVRRCP